MTSATLTRVRFPFDMLTRLDALALELRAIIRRRVPRAALIRALLRLSIDTAIAPELVTAIESDTVRRGREKGRVHGRRRAS